MRNGKGMMLRGWWLVACALSLSPALAFAQPVVAPEGETGEWEDQPPDVEWVWEDGYVRPDGTTAEGFYRPAQREGWVWDPPHWDRETWVEPGWRWAGEPRVGYVIVTGHRGFDGYWVDETWRRSSLPGHDWVEGRWDGQVWIDGHFQPRAPRPGFTWEPGYWTPGGVWVDGQWRAAQRAGFVWVSASFRFGRWRPGYWRPIAVPAGQVWVPGYWNGHAWVDGRFRPIRVTGQRWVHGHWEGNVWVDGAWVASPAPVRRFRVQPVTQMVRARRAHIRRIRSGVRLQVHGQALENRGQALQQRGQQTGNVRMQLRGRRLENRGERQQLRGQIRVGRGRR